MKIPERSLRYGKHVVVVILLLGTSLPAQDILPPGSDLASQNLNIVAASAADIKVILVRDAGMMVALKKWAAKDATDHGQVVSEQDLTDQAILDRLESDVRFRAAATQLVQSYGYLLPQMNPDSEMGKQQALLMQERAKLIAQQGEQSLTPRNDSSAQSSNVVQCQVTSGTLCAATNEKAVSTQGFNPSGTIANPTAAPSIAPNQGELPSAKPALPTNSNSSLELTDYLSSANQRGGESIFSADPSTFASPIQDPTEDLPNNTNTLAGGSPVVRGILYGGFGEGPRKAPEPTLARVAEPYNDIPSLYDMYLQAVPQPGEPTRFGFDVFQNGTRDLQSIPMDLPAGPDYVVGPGDGLAINVWGGVSQRLYSTVDREGRITLPEVGPVLVSGKSLADVQENLQQAMRTQFRDTSVDVSLSRLRTIRVYEVGDVAKPGAYDISSLSTSLNALFAAGGPTAQGSMRMVKHYRGSQLLEEVDLYDLLLNGVKTGMAWLDNGDTILVPPSGAEVTVEGMVRRPAIYELKNEKTLADVIALAGGVLPAATLRHIEVQRLVAHDRQTMLSLDIPETENTAVAQRLAAFDVQDGDRIRIYPIAPYNQNAVYLEGHVMRPGRYSYKENLRVGDLISSFKDLLPEPATQYAEIIRLNAPDFRPTVKSFDLSAAIESPSTSPVLQPMDTVRIFGRYDFEDAPTVCVLGDVRKPGTYPTSGQIHLADAIHLAGGLSPNAELQDAQVFRYLPDGEAKIFSISLGGALAGDPTQNIELQARDRVLVHGNPAAEEPSTVYVEGEIAQPGRYPLTNNMTVADLIKVGGGLRPSADTETADLMRYEYSAKDAKSLTAQHQAVPIAAVLSNDSGSRIDLRNGDVLTIRQLPGWGDLGASITLKGEVVHPGTYGIRPGEKLSAILERAGGFQSDAYPRGTVLQRVQVRELESKAQDQLILRVKDEESSLESLPDTDAKAKQAKDLVLQQYQTTLTQLNSTPPLGRVAIRISDRVDRWKNTPADIEVRAGDTLTIPKRPDYVMVTGQVFEATAVAFRPGRSAKWYLSQSGGPTALANKKAIFVVRADGSVLGERASLLAGDPLNAALEPGDTVVVPEKAIGGGPNWQNLFTSAQVASSIASTVFIALRY